MVFRVQKFSQAEACVTGTEHPSDYLIGAALSLFPLPVWYPHPSPCFGHQYQNKGVTAVDYAKNIKLKDLSRMIPNENIGRSGQVKSFVVIFLRARPAVVIQTFPTSLM